MQCCCLSREVGLATSVQISNRLMRIFNPLFVYLCRPVISLAYPLLVNPMTFYINISTLTVFHLIVFVFVLPQWTFSTGMSLLEQLKQKLWWMILYSF
jgi:hypothetical protein